MKTEPIYSQDAAVFEPMSTVLTRQAERMKERKAGILTGISCLDDFIGGLHLGMLSVIAGRESSVLSKVVQNIVLNLAVKQKISTGVMLSHHMSKETYAYLLALQLGDLRSLPYGDVEPFEMADFNKVTQALRDSPLTLNHPDKTKPGQCHWRKQFQEAIYRSQLKVVFIHDIPALCDTDYPTTEDMDSVLNFLKKAAAEQKVAIVAVGGIHPIKETKKESHRPSLFDLHDSNDIQTHADTIILTHHEKPYRKHDQPWLNLHRDRSNEIELLVAKNSYGVLGRVSVKYDCQSGSYLLTGIYFNHQ